MDQPLNIRKRVRQVYAPPCGHARWGLEALAGDAPLRYVRLGRHALYHALKGLGVGAGDDVLVPSFICKELLSAIHALGARPLFYAVSGSLGLGAAERDLPPAKAIVAVNFFGFPQDLAPFRAYCARTGAYLVEDNAHGLFGRDAQGRYLGTRGDVGIFSPRKSLDVTGGGALVVNDPRLAPRFDLVTTYSPSPVSRSRRLKGLFRASVDYVGIGPVRLFIRLSRFLRRLRTGRAIPVSSPESEFSLPPDDGAPDDLAEQFSHVDAEAEIARRRELYEWLHASLQPQGVRAVFGSLPAGVIPYGYPMHLEPGQVEPVKRWLARYGLECFTWPDLPAEVAPAAPDWYRQIWIVQFLW